MSSDDDGSGQVLDLAVESLHRTVADLEGLRQPQEQRSLMQRRKQRHDAAVADFEARARELNIELENAVERVCVELKQGLAQGHRECGATLQDGVAEAEVLATVSLSDPDASAEEAEYMQTLGLLEQDDDDGVTMRRRRILCIKAKMLSLRGKLADLSTVRLRCIASFADAISSIDQRRRTVLSRYLRELLDKLREVSWEGDEGIAALAQLKGTEINLSIAANKRTIVSLIGRLLRREVEAQRALEAEFEQRWGAVLDATSQSAARSTLERVCSDTYCNPSRRRVLIGALVGELVGAPLRDRLLSASLLREDAHAALTPQQELTVSRRVQEGLQQTALHFSSSGEPLPQPVADGVLCATRPPHAPRALPGRVRAAVVCGSADGLYTVDALGPDADEWQGVDPSRMQVLSAQLGRWEGTPLGGLVGGLHRNLAALCRMAMSLSSLPPMGPAALPAPGGAVPGGWLEEWRPPEPPTAQQLQLGGTAGSVVTDPTPTAAGCASEKVEEWRGSVRLFTTRIKALHAEYSARARQQEEELLEDAEREAWLLHTDIGLIYEPQPAPPSVGKVSGPPADADDALLCALRSYIDEPTEAPPTELLAALVAQSEDVKARCEAAVAMLPPQLPLPIESPTHAAGGPTSPTTPVGGPGERMRAERARASEDLAPHLERLREESKEYLAVLAHQMAEQQHSLFDECLARAAAVIPTFKGAAMFLEDTAAKLAALAWNHHAAMLECELTFNDADRQREQRFSELVSAVLHGASREEVDDCFAQALSALKDIESSYHQTYRERDAKLSDYIQRSEHTVAEVRKALFTALCVETEESYQLRLRAPPPAEDPVQQQMAGTGSKKGGKKPEQAPPVDEQPALPPRDSRVVWSPWGMLRETGGPAELLLGDCDADIDPMPELPARSPPPPPETEFTDDESRLGAASAEPKGKGKKKDTAADEKRDAELRAEMQQRRKTDDQKRELRKRTEAQILPYLPRDMLMPVAMGGDSEGLRPAVFRVLRQQMLSWMHAVTSSAMEGSRRHCDGLRHQLQSWRSDRLRLHQRRAPNLESNEYSRRLRQLVETAEVREREFAAIEKRFEQTVGAVLTEQEGWQASFEHDLSLLQERRAALPTAPTLAALATQDKLARALKQQIEQQATKAEQRVFALFEQAGVTMVKEAHRFLKDNVKGFSEGGSMCEEEVSAVSDAVAAAEGRTHDAVAAKQAGVRQQGEAQRAALEEEHNRYQVALADSRADLEFLRQIGEKVSVAKQVLMGHISKSVVQEREIEELTETFEGCLKRITPRTPAAEYSMFMSADPDLGVRKVSSGDPLASFRRGRQADTMSLAEDSALSHTDARMAGVLRVVASKVLRQAKLQREAKVQANAAQQLLQLADDLRRLLYSRGLFLSALKFGLPLREVGYLNPKQYLEPRAGAFGEPPGTAESGVRPSSGKKGKAAAEPKEPAQVADEAGGWDDFLNVDGWQREAARATAVCKRECEPVIADYYAKKGDRPVTRPDLLAATADSFRAWLSRRLEEHEATLRDHVDGVMETYKRQVTRVFLAAQRLPQEVFNQLYNLCFSGLEDTAAACKGLFEAHYTESMRQKRLHGEKVKCCMTNPANRHEMAKTEHAEEQRHQCSELLVRTFHKLLLREESDEGRRFRARSVQATQTLFKILQTLVTPDIVAGRGDVIVGRHRSLKRLRKAQARDQGQPDAAADAGAAAQAKGKGKKEEAKPPKPAAKPGKGGKDAKEEGADSPLPLLEKATVVYPGLKADPFRAFDEHDKKHPTIVLNPAKPQPKEDPEAAAAAPPGKGKPAPKKAPPAKEPAKKGAAAAEVEEDEDAVTDAVVGWRDAAFKATVYHRGQSFDSYLTQYGRRCSSLDQLFEGLLAKERTWYSSWNKLIESLHPERSVAEG